MSEEIGNKIPNTKECIVCGQVNPMFVWSSSRSFPLEELSELISKKTDMALKQVDAILEAGVPVCIRCRNKLKVSDKND